MDNGLSWGIVAQPVDASIGEYSWITADAKTPYVLIRISDVYNPFVYDVSDKSFALDFNERSNLNKSAQVSSTTIKIMPLGDSITWGTNPDDANSPGYRRSLYSQLTNAGYIVDFVGSLSGGLPNDFDRDNEGHPGWVAGDPAFDQNGRLDTKLKGFLTSNPPDIVLLLIGTNDITEQGNQWEKTAAEVTVAIRKLIDTIYVFNPNIKIFVGKIIDRVDNQYRHDKTVAVNSLLQTTIDSLSVAEKSKITIIDMYTPLGDYYSNHSNPNFTYGTDNLHALHPNNAGYQTMENTWFTAFQNFYQPVLSSPTNNATNQVVNLSLTWNAPPAASIMSVVYDLQVAVDTNFINVIFEDMIVPGTSKQPTGLIYGTKYYWRVKIPGYGWSAVSNFTTVPMLVSAKVFLEGPYSSGTMSTALNIGGYLPNSQPFFGGPWYYGGGESVSAGFFASNTSIVDWVLVQLRSSTTTVTTTKAAFLKNDGSIVDLDGISLLKFSGISGGDYYIVVKHRNHLSVMSAVKVTLPNAIIYDFTSGSGSQLYGGTAGGKLLGTSPNVWGLISGDGNSNGQVQNNDSESIWKLDNGTSGYKDADFNMNSQVQNNDNENYWKPNNGRASQVP